MEHNLLIFKQLAQHIKDKQSLFHYKPTSRSEAEEEEGKNE